MQHRPLQRKKTCNEVLNNLVIKEKTASFYILRGLIKIIIEFYFNKIIMKLYCNCNADLRSTPYYCVHIIKQCVYKIFFSKFNLNL